MARLSLPISRAQSEKLQLEAHKKNRYLIKPATGMVVSQLQVSAARMADIISWVRECGSVEQLNNAVQDIVSSLQFGVGANRFEGAFDELGKALGFSTERPDKQWKAGPDNLWALEHGHYLLVECKSQVDTKRAEIAKDETGQMNNACAWFQKNYPGCQAAKMLIIPTNHLGKAAGFLEQVQIMRDKELKTLLKQTKDFFNEFGNLDWKSLTEIKIQELINLHHLTVKNIIENYGVKPK